MSRYVERVLSGPTCVCVNGWSLEAAEALGATAHIPSVEVLDLLGHLVAKSMVVVDAQPGVTPDETRSRLLESIRDYAEQKLFEADEAALLHEAHCA